MKAVGVREKSKYMRIYYDLLANGKKNLFNSVLRFPRLAAAILQECDSRNEVGFEHNLEQFYILDDLADSWDVNRESERIQTFIKILNCPGAMEIYVQAGKYAKSVFLPEARDYSTAAEIVRQYYKDRRNPLIPYIPKKIAGVLETACFVFNTDHVLHT